MMNRTSTASNLTTNASQEAGEEEVFVFPASFTQERLWLLEQLSGEKAIYNLAGALHLRGELQIPILEQALTEIVGRQEILRTTFPLTEGRPVQAITSGLTLPMEVMDWQEKPEAQQREEINKWMEQESQRPFDLAHGPLWNVKLIQCSPESSILFLVMHHIIGDGWSVGRFLHELSTLYGAFSKNAPSPLPELEIQYADYAEWEREWLKGEVLDKQLHYWQQQLTGAPPTLDLPTDFSRPQEPTFRGAREELQLSPSLAAALQALSLDQGVTLFATLLAGLNILLTKWTGQEDLVVGTVTAGRNRTETEPLIGCFMNFLALRSQPSEAQTVQAFLQEVGQTVLDAYSHQDCPFEKVVEVINPARKTSQNPLYNVALLLQNFPLDLQFDETLEASPLPITTGASLLDMRFEVFTAADQLLIQCEYSTDLFEAETIQWLLEAYGALLQDLVERPDAWVAELEIAEKLKAKAQAIRAKKASSTLALAATFTAEPLKETLEFWMHALNLPFEVEFAPYHQVFQELLHPDSLLAQNQAGVNGVLIRLEDLVEDGVDGSHPKQHPLLAETLQDLVKALQSASGRSATPYLVCLCPPSPQAMAEPEQKTGYEELEHTFVTSLKSSPHLLVITPAELARYYPVEAVHDPKGDALAHIPYTAHGFAALGTMIARKLHALQRKPYKVIVLDCDQTLWKGVCGEDGAEGIVVTEAHHALQAFMVRQQRQGKLLCLCSKNEAEDVFAVFDHHPSMPLQREHLVATRINWEPKSKNLQSLAQALQLGLDSFIFVDDNPVECAEVQANCPDVLTVQLPEDVEQFPHFLDHVWAFDSLQVTAEDQTRTALYRDNAERERFREETLTFEDFLAGLGLQVDITPAQPDQLSRISQLTRRTNQFNLTTIRRSEAEIQQLVDAGTLECLAVQVKDRFGDYGLVGVFLFGVNEAVLTVDTFLLSCRALGRGVEHQMLARLGTIASDRTLSHLEVPLIPTAKNQPAQDFLASIGQAFKQPDEQGVLFRLPAAEMARLTFKPGTAIAATGKGTAPQKDTRGEMRSAVSPSALYQHIARDLSDPEQLIALIGSRQPWQQRGVKSTFVPPRNATEEQIANIWRDILKVKEVGIYDDFFALGGSSLLGVQVINRVGASFNVELPLVRLFEQPTVSGIAESIEKVGGLASISAPINPNQENREEIEL